jgi:hypothetical protein
MTAQRGVRAPDDAVGEGDAVGEADGETVGDAGWPVVTGPVEGTRFVVVGPVRSVVRAGGS